MGRIYDNWDRLIGATLKREQFRELARADSRDPSFSSISSDFSSTISLSSPLHDQSEDGILGLPSAKPISFKELRSATRNFWSGDIIGGGFGGCVYKGWIDEYALTAANPGSGTPVAIKTWKPDGFQGFSEWLTIVNYLMQLRHPNLIRLIAYCHEGDNMILVNEFMPRGSLDNHLFPRGQHCLSWATRIKVAVGVARGLSLLHNARNKVRHRYLQPAHILLDEEFNAKLSGFSLAKDRRTDDNTHVATRIVDTMGYDSPQYAYSGRFTEKCDIYAFGVILLELLSGRLVIDRPTGKTHQLVWCAKTYLSENKNVDQIMDAKLKGHYNKEEALIVAELALQCTSFMPRIRPCMAEVLATLERF